MGLDKIYKHTDGWNTEPYESYKTAKETEELRIKEYMDQLPRRKVLVLEAHIDDADSGCGSTVYKHIRDGDDVQWHTFITKGYRVPEGWHEDSLITEYQKAKRRLAVDNYVLYDYHVDTLDRSTELRNLIYAIWYKFDPDVAYIPLRYSRHQDHRAVGDFAWQVSWRSHADILAYPVLNDFENFNPNVFSVIDNDALEAKIAALKMYHSQFNLRPWFSIILVRATMQHYAVFTNGKGEYVEPFEQVKRVLR